MDELLKLVIPAIFLIVWALGQLMNREPKQPQARPIPRGAPGGLPPRPDLPPRPTQPGPLPQPTMRWGDDAPERTEPSPLTVEPRRSAPDSEEIVILGTDVGPPRATPHRPAARGSSRPRPAPAPRRPRRAASPPRPEPTEKPSRNLASVGGLGGSVSAPVTQVMTTDPASTISAATVPPGPRVASPATARIRQAILSPERVREALVINELLGPPLALRKRGPRR